MNENEDLFWISGCFILVIMVLREVFKDVNIMQQAPDNLGAVSEVS
jgi:hypothetical protein